MYKESNVIIRKIFLFLFYIKIASLVDQDIRLNWPFHAYFLLSYH